SETSSNSPAREADNRARALSQGKPGPSQIKCAIDGIIVGSFCAQLVPGSTSWQARTLASRLSFYGIGQQKRGARHSDHEKRASSVARRGIWRLICVAGW